MMLNGFPSRPGPSTPTSVHVEVKGSIEVPLNLALLADLGDPMMEQEIIKEAVRIAVSEKLGCFDAIDVRLSTSGGREGAPAKPSGQQHLQQLTESPTATAAAAATTRSYTQRYCEAEVDLQRLGGCIDAIQHAYENLLVNAHLLQEVLSGTGPLPWPRQASHSEVNTAQHQHEQQQQQQSQQQHSQPTSSGSVDPFHGDARGGASCFAVDDAAAGAVHNRTTNMYSQGNCVCSDHSSPVDPSVAHYADALQRIHAARQLVDTMLSGRRSDVVSEAAALRSADQLRHEEVMLELERRGNGGADRDNGPAHVRPRIDHEDGVDAELRRGLLADDDDEELSGREQAGCNDDEHNEDDMDEEAMHERYIREGYAPL